MLRSSIYTASAVLLGSTAFAQGNAQSKLQPITAPVKDAGIYHVGTGLWTHSRDLGSMAQATGVGIIYDNTCDMPYYSGTVQNELNIDDGRLPSTGSPAVPGLYGNNSEVGTQNSYVVDGLEFAYCTNVQGPNINYILNFYDLYTPCATSATVTSIKTITLAALPGSMTAGTQACWFVNFDLTATTDSFTMQADGQGTFEGTPAQDNFGWSFRMNYAPFAATTDGPLIAGSVDNSAATYLLDCSGSDGTVFDTGTISPVYPANDDAGLVYVTGLGIPGEMGSGMGNANQFRSEGATVADGCYWFGAALSGSFHLELWSNNVTLPSINPMIANCDPGIGGVLACPCGNPPAGTPRGCDNSSGTGGAIITATGVASLGADTLVFTTADERPTATTVLVQGNAAVPTGAIFGQGIRCTAGLKRLYVKAAVGGSITAPVGADPTVSAQSSALGDPISAGTLRWYFAYYRDPILLGTCGVSNPLGTFNATAGGEVLWGT